MSRVKLIGNTYNASSILSNSENIIPVILLPGIGDVIYTWYKLIHIVRKGYKFSVYTTSECPRRSHQIMGTLEGMEYFSYLDKINFEPYFLKQVYDPLNPSEDILYDDKPVLHINSFIESGQFIDDFMPNYPCDYDIDLNTNDKSKLWAKGKVNDNKFNIVLYCSSYTNNKKCNVHPDPEFWANLALICHEIRGDKALKVFVIGANYDADLTIDTHNLIKNMGYETELLLNSDFYYIIDLIRYSDMIITYESGIGMISDVTKTPCLQIFRKQGGTRDDRNIAYSGLVNPKGIGERFFPFCYDDSLEYIKRCLK